MAIDARLHLFARCVISHLVVAAIAAVILVVVIVLIAAVVLAGLRPLAAVALMRWVLGDKDLLGWAGCWRGRRVALIALVIIVVLLAVLAAALALLAILASCAAVAAMFAAVAVLARGAVLAAGAAGSADIALGVRSGLAVRGLVDLEVVLVRARRTPAAGHVRPPCRIARH